VWLTGWRFTRFHLGEETPKAKEGTSGLGDSRSQGGLGINHQAAWR